MAEKKKTFKEEGPTSFQAEVNARIPYLMGLNAKQQMMRDPFLVNFIPSATRESMSAAISPEMLAKYGIRNIDEEEYPEDVLETLIYDDTRILNKVAEASFESKYKDWRKEVATVDKVKAMSQAALDIIANCVRQNSRTNLGMSGEQQQRTCSEIQYLNSDITALTASIDSEYTRYMEDTTLSTEEKMGIAKLIKKLEKDNWDYTVAKNARIASLVAEGHFGFSEKLSDKNKKMTREKYISAFVTKGEEHVKKLKADYMEKYGVVPSYVNAYAEIIALMPKLSREISPDMNYISTLYQNEVLHYTDLLTEGPNMILQITKMFPDMVRELDAEKAIYSMPKADEYMNAFVKYTDEDDKFRARNAFAFSFTNILGDSETKSIDAISDLQVLAIYGPPGVGKTASVSSLMKTIGYNCLQISMPAADSTLFTGMPIINEKDKVIQSPSANLAPAIENPGVITIDEATVTTDPGVPPQLARFLQLGEVAAGRKIHPLSTIVLMANDDIEHNPDVQPFSGIVQTRIKSVFRKEPNILIAGWLNWVLNNKGLQNDRMKKAAYDLILSFLLTSSDGPNYWIQKGANETSGISPNFRTWSNLADEVGKIISNTGRSVNTIAEFIRTVSNETVGTAAASSLSKHYQVMANLPTINELLKRMDPADGKPLAIKDAIRIFDMNNAQIVDSTKDYVVKKNTAETETPEDADGKKTAKKKEGRFRLAVDSESDKILIEKINQVEKVNGTGKRKFTVSDLMPVEELEKRYNDIWGDKRTDLTSTAVLFHFMSQIQYQMQLIFRKAENNQAPVDGKSVDSLFKLAMTLPAKDPRQALIIKMMNSLINDENSMVLYNNGIRYENENKAEIIFKIVPPQLKTVDNKVIKTDIKKLQDENKDPKVQYSRTAHVILPRRMIMGVSEAYAVNVDDPKKKKKTEKDHEDEYTVEV